MFDHTQDIYDLVYEGMGRDYRAESQRLREILRDHGIDSTGGRRPRLLDVACGTGRHLALLEDFDRVGLDLDPGMLEIAGSNCPEVRLVEADMRALDAIGSEPAFDVVSCLFSSIAYMANTAELGQAISAMAERLRPGGVLLVEPFIEPGDYVHGYLDPFLVESPERSVTRMSSTRLEGNTMHLDLHYLLGDSKGVRYFVEPHILTLFERDEITEAMNAAGVTTTYLEDGLVGRGMHVGIRI
ncbi:MAG: class I SAM-dependent methyltransferase [Phycisphaerales bacterium]|nr:class I SAM-dependent methyltransferase [Phycisphaerales bacterium]